MTKELKKRIITSIILFIAAILCIVINEVIFFFAILIIFARCFHEWNDINLPYFFIKKKNRGKFVFVRRKNLCSMEKVSRFSTEKSFSQWKKVSSV